jgi:hypothetical protein
MRITLLGKLVLLMLAVGVAYGGYNYWQKSQGTKASSSGNHSTPVSTNQQRQTTSSNGRDIEIEFVTTAAKKGWISEQVSIFNANNQGKWRIVTKELASRKAMHDILSGKVKPVLWSPGSPIWPQRLAEAYGNKNSNSNIVDLSDPNGYRVFLRSPLVFMTTKRKAEFLRPLLSGSRPWLALRDLSTGKTKTPWGGFRFSQADPINSSSGMMTLGLIMYDYAQRTGQAGNMNKLSTDKAFINYLKELNRSLVYDKPAIEGTTKLTNAFIEDTSRYDLITGYEASAIKAAANDPNIAVIYPNPTSVSEHAVSLLNGDWISSEQKEGAIEFIRFLGSRESLQSGLKDKFRPVQSSSTLSINDELAKFAPRGFQQNFTTTDLPPYEALNATAFRWTKEIATARSF